MTVPILPHLALDPAGPDGWQGMYDPIVIGAEDGEIRGKRVTAKMLWVEPGGGCSYVTASIHLASIMLRHLTGMELEEYVRRKLAEPMGFGRFGWGYKSMIPGHTAGGGGVAPRPTDMLRFAYLLLREGRWGDRQLVPAEYVRLAGSPSPYNPHFDYSLQFNVNGNGRWDDIPRDAFWKVGSGGFCIYIVPSLEPGRLQDGRQGQPVQPRKHADAAGVGLHLRRVSRRLEAPRQTRFRPLPQDPATRARIICRP